MLRDWPQAWKAYVKLPSCWKAAFSQPSWILLLVQGHLLLHLKGVGAEKMFCLNEQLLHAEVHHARVCNLNYMFASVSVL